MEGIESFDDFDKAVERAKEIKGIVVSYRIQRMRNGKYKVYISVDSYDELTQNVFVKTEDGVRIRNVVDENENTYYEDAGDDGILCYEMEFESNSFASAKEKLKEMLEEIFSNRKKVRLSCKEEEGYIVF